MSEHQIYQFCTLDKPLNREQRGILREISTRAQITPTSFVNEYHYGDLKADPIELVGDFFDVGLHICNWGELNLYVKVPYQAISADVLSKFEYEGVFSYHRKGEHWVLHFALADNEEVYDCIYDWLCDAEDIFADIIPLRAELIGGDYRSLMLVWLSIFSLIETTVDLPLFIADYRQLTSTQQILSQLLLVDEEHLETLTHYCQSRQKRLPDSAFPDGKRPVEIIEYEVLTEYYSLAEAEVENRRRAELEQQQKQLEKQRQAELNEVYRQAFRQWNLAQFYVEKGHRKAYEQGVDILQTLYQAYELHLAQVDFADKFTEFISQHQNRRSFLKLLKATELADWLSIVKS
ncbi:hypothetical protein DXX93_01605 [Thalassotalea euphylliae]|uniref:Uncharacterized protein n=1 Tax=Thalassotalea euphylliae TaxID=1655234 RepID=A0A3E0TLI0_9GAMM|nr:hypothetical protein [Thalassotalea euphylliae]REL25368.1 hypothetical protein DXX93_01605 [Thalassotalea euphylliae]